MADGNGLTKADLDAFEARLILRFENIDERFRGLDERFQGLDERFQGLDERFQGLHDYIDERTRDMQTELLRGFAAYQDSATIRMEKLSADVSNINISTDKRLAVVEQRLSELERRIAEKGL